MSPTVFRESGFRFYFFSREETRMHVHVQAPEGEAKFWLEPAIELAHNYGLRGNFAPSKPLSRYTQVTSAVLGQSTSAVEVTNVSKHGFWLLLGDEELFVPFAEFPWFREAPIGKLTEVELPSPHHLYWPALDVDLAVESIRHPEQFPLVSRAGA